MRKISKAAKKAYSFWKDKAGEKEYIVSGRDFPDEYARKLLQQEDLVFTIKRGLYLLKNKGDAPGTFFYPFYWPAVAKLMEAYQPWSIEKEIALNIYLGDESIPQALKIRTGRNVKHILGLPFGLKIYIRPDPAFEEKTRRQIKISDAKLYIDLPEKVLLGLRRRKGINFISFIKGMKFDRRFMEILYAENPKPVRVKELAKIAKRIGRADLAAQLGEILKEYTIYR